MEAVEVRCEEDEGGEGCEDGEGELCIKRRLIPLACHGFCLDVQCAALCTICCSFYTRFLALIEFTYIAYCIISTSIISHSQSQQRPIAPLDGIGQRLVRQ